MAQAVIIGTGLYAPGDPIDNETVMKLTGIQFDAARQEEKSESKIDISHGSLESMKPLLILQRRQHAMRSQRQRLMQRMSAYLS